MNNLFESENYSDGVPSELTAGALFAWTRSDISAAYPTSLYTLSFSFTLLDSRYTEATFTAGKVGGSHVVMVSDTGSYVAGDYRWIAIVTRDSDSASVQVDEGFATIRSSNGADSSYVYRTLLAIRATIEGTASNEQSKIEIGGRVLEYRSPNELIALEREYSKRWAREVAEINRKAGRPAKSRTLVKMGA
jgi:hypothetical protein